MHGHEILTRAVLDWCAQQGISFKGKTILCAVSGGRDSMALLSVLIELGKREGFAVAAAHYNHHLRLSAQRDEDLVRSFCASHGIPLAVDGGDVRAYANENGTSVENAARTMRYEFLESAAQECGADYIATAHHRQDNAETLLLHLLRGSGLNGLGGIPPVRGNIIRPLLAVDRAEIDRYIETNNIPYAEDETNQDTVYTRNRLRHELLPLLEEIAPGSVRRIADTAARLRIDEDYLQLQSAQLEPLLDLRDHACIPVAQLRGQHRAIASRMVRSAAQRYDAELTAAQLDAVFSMRSGACLSLGGGVRVTNDGKMLRFYRLPDVSAPMELTLGEQEWNDRLVCVEETNAKVEESAGVVVLRGDVGALTIAVWDGTGRLGVENGRRTVKRLLADHHISASQRENCPAIYADGVLAAVFGAGTDIDFRAVDGEIKLVVSIH